MPRKDGKYTGSLDPVWYIVLILNFLAAERQRTAVERQGIERDTDEINPPKEF